MNQEKINQNNPTNASKAYIKNIKGVGHRDLKIGNGWCVEGDKGSYHRLHNHTFVRENSKTDDGIACVLYLDVPNDDDRGEFYYLVNTENGTQLNCLMPNKGDLIIMPKTVWHGVYPQTSEGLRRTLNFELTQAFSKTCRKGGTYFDQNIHYSIST